MLWVIQAIVFLQSIQRLSLKPPLSHLHAGLTSQLWPFATTAGWGCKLGAKALLCSSDAIINHQELVHQPLNEIQALTLGPLVSIERNFPRNSECNPQFYKACVTWPMSLFCLHLLPPHSTQFSMSLTN